ncbi:MAG: hypothetical protein UV38_C0003G0026 [candidate division TM6 bacterium GW2011_GWE2_42_60]|nr:MAG: hypothetical protein UV38_C0003G0026 [candidate division TM6 bacterium GW2011_GWE2_42_60]
MYYITHKRKGLLIMKFLLRLLITITVTTSTFIHLGATNGNNPLAEKRDLLLQTLELLGKSIEDEVENNHAIYEAVQSGQPSKIETAFSDYSYYMRCKFYEHNLPWKSTLLGLATYNFTKKILNPGSVALNDVSDRRAVIKLLVSLGANINATDKFGRTPLFVLLKMLNLAPKGDIEAINWEVKKLIRFFIKKGADMSEKVCGQWATLLLKIAHSDEKILKKMVFNASTNPNIYMPFFEQWLKEKPNSLSTIFASLLEIDQNVCEKKLAKNPLNIYYYLALMAVKKLGRIDCNNAMLNYTELPMKKLPQYYPLEKQAIILKFLLEKKLQKQQADYKLSSKLNIRLEEDLQVFNPSKPQGI